MNENPIKAKINKNNLSDTKAELSYYKYLD